MSDHSDVSYMSEEGDVFGQQQQQHRGGGGGPALQYGRGSRRPPAGSRISHASSLGSSAVGDDLLQDTAAATSWQVRLDGPRHVTRQSAIDTGRHNTHTWHCSSSSNSSRACLRPTQSQHTTTACFC